MHALCKLVDILRLEVSRPGCLRTQSWHIGHEVPPCGLLHWSIQLQTLVLAKPAPMAHVSLPLIHSAIDPLNAQVLEERLGRRGD